LPPPDQEAAKRRILVVQDTEHPAERFRVRRDDARLHGPPFYSSDTLNPLAAASPLLRRRLLAAACGIIETNPEIGAALFGPDAPSAIERFIARADRGVLDRLLMTDGHWSSAFISQIKAARERMARRFTISKLEAAHRAIRNVFAHASTNEQTEPRDLAGQS
jgi:hypothetical protein